jgi:hypothetical protein
VRGRREEEEGGRREDPPRGLRKELSGVEGIFPYFFEVWEGGEEGGERMKDEGGRRKEEEGGRRRREEEGGGKREEGRGRREEGGGRRVPNTIFVNFHEFRVDLV